MALEPKRRGRPPIVRPTPPLAPAVDVPIAKHYSRGKAAAWFAERGFEHLTLQALNKLATRGRGPRYAYVGKYAYYSEADLTAWLSGQLAEKR